MSEDAKTPRRRGTHRVWSFLIFMATLAAVWFAFIDWPVVQMYACAAVAMLFMMFTAWRSIRALPLGQKGPWYQFGLGTVLVWVVPYTAAFAWIISWKGPYEVDFLNANVKSLMLVILTQAWVSGFTVVRSTVAVSRSIRLDREAQARRDTSTTAPFD
jgi:hypothetical protein